MTDQIPAIVQPGALATPTDTYLVPALIAAAGDQAGWRYVEFFTANIHNDNTRRGIVTATKSGRIRGGRRGWRHEAATRSPLPPPVPRRDHQLCGLAVSRVQPQPAGC
jgi:hypothetical protein